LSKVLLLKPFTKDSYTIVPPIGLAYLSSVLKKNGIAVQLIDGARERLSSADIIQIISKDKPEIVGINFYTNDFYEVKGLLRQIKEYDPKIVTVAGGPHPSALPEETLNALNDLDYVLIGEAEIGFPRLAKGFPPAEIEGLAWREDGQVRLNPPKLVENLDSLGAPDWEAIPPPIYSNAPLGGFARAVPIAYLLTSRGCPFPCTFCAGKNIYGNKIRWRSLENVIAEIEYLINKYGVKEFHILDDNFAYRKEYVISFCNEIIKRGIKVNFNCSNGIRLESLNFEIFQLMRRAGFYSFSVGIESGSSRILKDMRKGTSLDALREKISLARKAGLEITGLFIVGYPTETEEDILKTIEYAKSIKINKAAFTAFLPLPGSPIYNELKASGKIDKEDWKNFSYYVAPKSYMAEVSTERLNQLLKKAFKSFYFRPAQIYYMIKNIASIKHLKSLIKRVFGQLLQK